MMGGKIENSLEALGAPLLPLFVASLLSAASAPSLGPGGVPLSDFSILPPIVKKRQNISRKNPDVRQIFAISQKNVAIYIISTKKVILD